MFCCFVVCCWCVVCCVYVVLMVAQSQTNRTIKLRPGAPLETKTQNNKKRIQKNVVVVCFYWSMCLCFVFVVCCLFVSVVCLCVVVVFVNVFGFICLMSCVCCLLF